MINVNTHIDWFFFNKTSKKVYVPPEVYVTPQDNIGLAYITAMYVEELNLF